METLDQVLPSQLEKKISLTEDQQKMILDIWNSSSTPPSISFLVQKVFNNPNLNGKNLEGRLIKEFLATRELKPKTTTRDPVLKTGTIILTEEQKLYIQNNVKNNGPTDIAKTLFNNSNLTPLSAETRVICDYIKTLNVPKDIPVKKEIEDIPDGSYEPPKTFNQVFERINKYLNHSLEKDKLSPKQKREIEKVIKYLNTHRFIKQINEYDSQSDRNSFEDAFIRWIHDKEDLTQEEIDQYITLANEVVISFKIQRQNEKMRKLLEQITGNDPDHIRISMSLVDAISGGQNEYNSSVNRQQKLLNDLTEKRSIKTSKEIKATSSILNLLNLWKEEEGRKALIRLGDMEQAAIGKEIEKQEGMEEIRLKVLGLTREEAIYKTL